MTIVPSVPKIYATAYEFENGKYTIVTLYFGLEVKKQHNPVKFATGSLSNC